MPPPTYRRRLRVEGLTLAASGAVGSVLLLALSAQATRGPLSTIGQLVLLAVALVLLGTWSTRRALRHARAVPREGLGTGEPTPLWQLPLIVAGLTLLVSEVVGAGWDAGLRVTAGCLLVGLAQAVLLERLVAGAEGAEGRSYHRGGGSRIGRGTRLLYPE